MSVKRVGNWYRWDIGNAHLAQIGKILPYNDTKYLEKPKKTKRSKRLLCKKLFKYYKRAKHGGSY